MNTNTRRTWRRWLLRIGVAFLLTILLLFGYVVWVSREPDPVVPEIQVGTVIDHRSADSLHSLGASWIRKDSSGLYEMYVEGDAYTRGLVAGKLSRDLVQTQEGYFQQQISRMVPSRSYLRILKYFVAWFNRDLSDHVKKEYQQEIFGVSRSASPEYNYVGTPYQRILNYHAAHDIGHALQNMMLVGCTSFGTWGSRSADGSLIIGRNFDFYVGDDFARDKIVSFVRPDSGYGFMSITWGGFIGVVSGMNEKGLTVTINAAKSAIPSGSATPVSLVAREILQYAANIREAMAIASRRTMFVSESFLLGSAEDGYAVVVEKTPEALALYNPHGEQIQCTNHFQSDALGSLPSNREQIQESASMYRFHRLGELLNADTAHSVVSFAQILRDRNGREGGDIGIGNEKAVNQMIAHHSVIFHTGQKRVWVSTHPWQLGAYKAYDLKEIFRKTGPRSRVDPGVDSLDIPADPFLTTASFRNFIRFRDIKQRFQEGKKVHPDSIVQMNPGYYLAYAIAGEASLREGRWTAAAEFFRRGLELEIATLAERRQMEEGLKKAIANNAK